MWNQCPSPLSWGLHTTYSKPRVYELPVACWPFLLTTIYKQCDVKTCCLSIKHQTLTCTIITCACSAYIRLLVKTQKKRCDSLKKVQSLASEFWHLLQPIEKRTINNFLRRCVISLSVNSLRVVGCFGLSHLVLMTMTRLLQTSPNVRWWWWWQRWLWYTCTAPAAVICPIRSPLIEDHKTTCD